LAEVAVSSDDLHNRRIVERRADEVGAQINSKYANNINININY